MKTQLSNISIILAKLICLFAVDFLKKKVIIPPKHLFKQIYFWNMTVLDSLKSSKKYSSFKNDSKYVVTSGDYQ